MTELKHARVCGGSKYDSLEVARCLAIGLATHVWINETPTVHCPHLRPSKTTAKGSGLGQSAGGGGGVGKGWWEGPVELDSSPTLWNGVESAA